MTESEIAEKMRPDFEAWLGEDTCEVHHDESANKHAWYGWQAGAQWAARRCVERLEKRAKEFQAYEGTYARALLGEARAIKKEWGLE